MKRLQKALHKNWNQPQTPAGPETKFLCDEGLGGLARWLRAFGYNAIWSRDKSHAELLKLAEEEKLFLLTCNTLLMDFKLIKDKMIRSLWVSTSLNKLEQFRLVKRELSLTRLSPRCMNCSGELVSVDKQEVLSLIPPKTQAWLAEYWQCRDCRKLFWKGTHWEKIEKGLTS